MDAQNNVAYLEQPSRKYNLLNLSISAVINTHHPIGFSIGCKNVLNEQYIDHLSRLKNIEMPAPGRNFYLSLNLMLNDNLKIK